MAYVKLLNVPTNPSTLKLIMEVFDGVSSYIPIAAEQIGDTDWYQLKGTFTLYSDASSLNLYVESSKASDSYYIDNVIKNPLATLAK